MLIRWGGLVRALGGFPLFTVAILMAAGCSGNAQRPALDPDALSSAAARGPAGEPAESRDRAAREPTLPAGWFEPIDESESRAGSDPAAQLLPGEVVSDAPHDELDNVFPELDPAELARLEQLAALPAEFDIPMVRNDKVLFWLDYYSNRRAESFRAGLVRSGRYIPMFRRIFAEAGLPADLVYMAHVESGYKASAYSRARAAGIFQFIAGTARTYGLELNYWVDERRDPEKSARAAAAYLKKLHEDFGDWYLALAAYNAGEGKIRRALRRSGGTDFWSLTRTRYIRRETKNYVPAILAATMIAKEPWTYGFTFDPEPPIAYDSIAVPGAVDLAVLAECAGRDLAMLKRLNPALRRYQTPPNATTDVRVPLGLGPATLAALAEVPMEERVLFVRHRVQRGDTLYELARTYGVTVGAIQQANAMGRSTTIRIGRVVKVPSLASGRFAAEGSPGNAAEGEVVTYRVRRGDTLSSISRRYNTNAGSIAAASNILVDKMLQIGERLTVVPGVRSSRAAQEIASGTTEPRPDGVHTNYRVRRGDSLWGIARRHRTTVAHLCALNSISRNSVLHPGTVLRVSR